MMICGDLNCTLDELSNDASTQQTIDSSVQYLKHMMQTLHIKDLYRKKIGINNNTYYNKSRTIESRIDYILGTCFIDDRITKTYMLYPAKIPDHKMVIIKLRSDVEIGKGYWKLNVSTLENEEYKKLISTIINETVTNFNDTLSPKQIWDFCKIRIREASSKFCKDLKEKECTHIKIIEKQILVLEKCKTNMDNKVKAEQQHITKLQR